MLTEGEREREEEEEDTDDLPTLVQPIIQYRKVQDTEDLWWWDPCL